MTDVRVVRFGPNELFLCNDLLLADSVLKDYCDFMCDDNLDFNEPLVKPDDEDTLGTDGDDQDRKESNQGSPLLQAPRSPKDSKQRSERKQLVLVRSCLSDVLYSLYCLGTWCTKRTIKLYISEFSRIVQSSNKDDDQLNIGVIGSTLTMLQCFYARLEELTERLKFKHEHDDILKHGSSLQLRTLLHYLKNSEPPSTGTWPICIVHVHRKIIAKVIALWLREVSNEFPQYAFIKPNYIVGSTRKHRNRMAVDNFDLHHEAAIRDFRFGKCNILVMSSMNERCADMLRCNLVVSFDFPTQFADFIQAKQNCRNDSSKYVIMMNFFLGNDLEDKALRYLNMEKIQNSSNKRDVLEPCEIEMLRSIEKEFPPYPQSNKGTRSSPATVLRSVSIINKYCAKLPSDSFTKLSPEWSVEEKDFVDSAGNEVRQYLCRVRLPINSPVRQTIIGSPAPTKAIALRLTAYTACKVLHKAGELDDNMLPIKKDSMKTITPWLKELNQRSRSSATAVKSQSLGSTKHRQYYKKRIASVFSGSKVTSGVNCFLYKFKMVLTCPIPDEQNRRGRRIIDPGETDRNYAIICANRLPKICSFPVFTRSGEVMITVDCIAEDITLEESQVQDLRIFHEYTFSKVLRLEKYPTMYDPENSPFTVLLAPVIDKPKNRDPAFNSTDLDWDFVGKIVRSDHDSFVPDVESRKKFKFNHSDYVDAVVIPWYRLTDRQQFAYYVAEICTNMTPNSSFPDETSGYDTFIDYYESKYNITIYNKEQPVLDVDHTSARLNLLTPRYVNRKGKTLPSSTAKTRRESRESLDRKQLLIPELCTIHPFPASFWRKAVCLPAIFYRLNSLFLAEELRREVAAAIKVGFVEPPEDFVWPDLDFGWSLKDVINGQIVEAEESIEATLETSQCPNPPPRRGKDLSVENDTASSRTCNQVPIATPAPESPITNGSADFVIDHFDPSKLNIPDIPLSASEEWMNIKLISSNDSGFNNKSGWDQEIEQRDLLLRHTNEITWDDCEMNFDGEITEKVPEMRCGSPSNFEPSIKPLEGKTFTCDGFSKIPHLNEKMVKFSGYSDEDGDSSDENGDSLDRSGILKPLENLHPNKSDSDSTWSVSDEDYNEEEETIGVNPDGDWRDEKSKKQGLLKELFVPYLKLYPNLYTQVEELYEKFKEFKKLPMDQKTALLEGLDSNTVTVVSDFLDKIEPLIAQEERSHDLSSILCDFFEDVDFHSTVSQQEADCWKTLFTRMNSLVQGALRDDPDLFKDNDIELIPVDDSPLDLHLKVQPTFGQLLPNRDTSGDQLPNESWKNIRFDPIRGEINSTGPGPSVILQALTMSNASDGINLERLETVGDSFLKYSITAYLYCMYPKLHEGKLSYLRSTEISNANLYQLGRAKNLGEIMSATKFEPSDNWLPPGYTVAIRHKKGEIDKALAEVPYDLLRQHSIPDKSIADCVEALIGAYLTASGSRAALLFMQWLGLRVVPPSYDLQRDLSTAEDDKSMNDMWRWLELPPSPLICAPPSYDEKVPDSLLVQLTPEELREASLKELHELYHENGMDKFEEEIQYCFKDKAYLVQAFTHNSYYKNHITDCHQRLEFLGDALLDYLITRYLFEDPRCHSPGTLTDLRSALVNNTFFASLAVKYNFHKYLKFISEELSHAIDDLVKKFRFNTKDTITKGYTLLIGEGESEYAEDIEVPKALGDVFESVAGAIYLDSGMSLDQVWQVYFKMMKPEIEYFSCNVPKSPIRELLESKPQNVRFSPSELAPDKKHRVTAEVFGLGRFTGVGRSKHSAKSTAAKRALRMLEIRKIAEREKENEMNLQ